MSSHAVSGGENMTANQFLRHAVATIAYRGGKATGGAPPDFGAYTLGESSRSAGQILAHLGDLMDWALSLADGKHVWRDSAPGSWEDDVARFFDGLTRLDRRLAAEEPLGCRGEQLFQGPLADALTHVGQIALLRRAAGAPIKGENYFAADIAAGRTGPEQSAPRREF